MKTVIEMAKEAGFTQPEGETWYEAFPQCIERFAELVASLARADAIADEHEACAKVCDDLHEANQEMLVALKAVLKIDRGTSGRIIIEGWQEDAIRAAIAKGEQA